MSHDYGNDNLSLNDDSVAAIQIGKEATLGNASLQLSIAGGKEGRQGSNNFLNQKFIMRCSDLFHSSVHATLWRHTSKNQIIHN